MKRTLASLRASDWLGLAAAPTFALMALLGWMSGGNGALLCSHAGQSLLTGMAPMYLLMALFHLTPWFRLTERTFHAA